MHGQNHKVSRIRLSVPVTIMLERRMVSRAGWQAPSWYVNGVLVGESLRHTATDGYPIGPSAQGEIFSWSGFRITFYKDACERYWHALIGRKPKVYVVCRDGLDQAESSLGLEPILITCDYDEAISYVETDELVLSTQIPAELYHHMEEFVLTHYKPKPFEKRKRKKWVSESEMGKPAREAKT